VVTGKPRALAALILPAVFRRILRSFLRWLPPAAGLQIFRESVRNPEPVRGFVHILSEIPAFNFRAAFFSLMPELPGFDHPSPRLGNMFSPEAWEFPDAGRMNG